jgi:cysteine-rich repeat protein
MNYALLVSIAFSAAGCTFPNEQHCWVMQGDKTCEEIFGGGYCSSDQPACKNQGAPYGCVFTRPYADECYSPTGANASCADANPAPECAADVEDTGESEASDNSETSNTSESPVCGDGVVDDGEACDDGNDDDTDDCTSSCALAECGDGLTHIDVEECDDGNVESFDGCNSDCAIQICGDAIIQAPEACDDGNLLSTDACVMCAPAQCGDGFVHQGVEACDDGDTLETNACTSDCAFAVCGDMIVHEGVEECDDGNSNNNDDCTDVCEDAACGDGYTQIGEECDDGDMDNGDGCSNMCNWEKRLVFATSVLYDGNLGGLAGADQKCNLRAEAAGLPGTYLAWISTQAGSPLSRFVKSTVPYTLVNGTEIADDWDDLVDGSLYAPIDRTEMAGLTASTGLSCEMVTRLARTGTTYDGSPGSYTCNNFTWGGNNYSGTVGRSTSPTTTWTSCTSGTCDIPMPIYCFQQ